MDGEWTGLFSLRHVVPHLRLGGDIKKLLQPIVGQSSDNLGVYLQYLRLGGGIDVEWDNLFRYVLEVLTHVSARRIKLLCLGKGRNYNQV